MFAAILVHEELPTSLYVGDPDSFNKMIDELDLRDALHIKRLEFLRDEGGEFAYIVAGNKLIIQKKKGLVYKQVNIRPEPKLRVLRGGDQLRQWFIIYADRLRRIASYQPPLETVCPTCGWKGVGSCTREGCR